MSNRRDFLKSASLLTAGGLLAGKATAMPATAPAATPVTTANKALGLQIYSLFNELYEDTPKRLAELREMGYVNLELAGYNNGKIGSIDMMEFKKMTEDAGQKLVSSHVNPPGNSPQEFFLMNYTRDQLPRVKEYWKATADDHAKLGCKYLLQPMMPTVKNHDDAALVCEFFNEAGQICKDAGLQFGYHSHNWEFKKVATEEQIKNAHPFMEPGDPIEDLFITGTDPNLVVFELDVYWTVRGGSDPLEYMQKYPDRIRVLHIKDRAVLGQSGLLNFQNIFNQMYTNGIQDYFVELEKMPDGRSQMVGIKECADYLQTASFVK